MTFGTEQRERELSIEHGKSAVNWLEVNNTVRMNIIKLRHEKIMRMKQ